MATHQHAFQEHPSSFHTSEQASINLDCVSVSQLLGRDYIFIDSHGIKLPSGNQSAISHLLNDLVQQLELSETHTVAVSVSQSEEGQLTFIRHDLTWYRHKISRVDSITITHEEQHEFMDMIWRCSTLATVA